MARLNVAFDVDGTLIGQTVFDEDTPKYDNIELFRWFARNGHSMFIWSGGGADYAKRWAEKLGLRATIIEKSKEAAKEFDIDIAVDDEAVQLGKVNIQV